MNQQRGGVMEAIDNFYRNLRSGRCRDCKYSKVVTANGGFMFLGCYYNDNKGKMCSEIKNCDKKEEEGKDEQIK